MPVVRLGSDPRSAARRPTDRAELLGQVLTPPPLALRMARTLLAKRPTYAAAILDPAAGPATFPAALAETGLLRADDELTLYDIDPGMTERASAWARTAPCRCRILRQDYLEAECGERFDLAILNPPYVRQEWIDQKVDYHDLFLRRYGVRIPGTSNLYVYFLVKAVRDLKPGGHLVAVVYDSWQSTRFGAWLSAYLQQECASVEAIPVANQPFAGRLIDATILLARRRELWAGQECPATHGQECPCHKDQWAGHSCPATHGQECPCHSIAGAPLRKAGPLADVAGLVPVSTLFHTRRGLRLKQADFFRAGLADVKRLGATPFIKKSAAIKGFRVPDDHPESALLASPHRADARVLRELERRLRLAHANPEDNVSILTWFRERPESWALHREPPCAPFLFNYYLRNRPRHLYNPHRAYADNFYGLTPNYPIAPQAALALLNATYFCVEVLAQARNQGSGLAKVQLFEYRQARLLDWRYLGKGALRRLEQCGENLAAAPGPDAALLERIDAVVAAELGRPDLRPAAVRRLYRDVERQAKGPATGQAVPSLHGRGQTPAPYTLRNSRRLIR